MKNVAYFRVTYGRGSRPVGPSTPHGWSLYVNTSKTMPQPQTTDQQYGLCNTPYSKQTRMQILRSCRCNLRSPSTDRRSDHGPCWWTVVHHCNPSPNQLRKLAKSRPTDRPTVRRSDHGPWSVSVDQDLFYQPLTQTTVDQHGPSFDPRSVGLTVDRRIAAS
ncbi:hypothetical protein MTR67_039779 [Solanum verrucosum]|uniref:Late blight resistance protein n=2 Tax=Solanum verrucosum TaxID=315347 RepID=A0AAF0UJM4_SOLVR|nr:hypothetical protein MTR67_039779 [Solanum verrucosum]